MAVIFCVLAEIDTEEGSLLREKWFKFHKKKLFSIETTFIEIFLSESKPMTVDIIYRPPSQTSFLETWMNIFINLLPSTKKPTYLAILT